MTLRRFGGPGMHGIGGVPLSSLGGAVHGGYFAKVLALGPIAYWPLWEASGTTARCLVNPAQNGTYSSDVSTWPVGPGIGDGNTAPRFDGANDFVNCQTATFATAFNGQEGSCLSWQQVSGAGVWTDGTTKYAWHWRVDGGNRIYCVKPGNPNRWDQYYVANTITEIRANTPFSSTAWFQQVITWSMAADEVKYYWGGDWKETDTTLGVFAGALGISVIGAVDTAPNNPWSGGIAHVAVFNRVLTDTEIADLAVL